MNRYKTIKQLLLFITYCFPLLSFHSAFAQCSCGINAGTKQYPSGTFTPTASWQYLGSIWGGNYTLFNVTSGNTYTWSYCSSDGGSASWDTRVNLYNNGSQAYIDCNADYCGLQSKLTWKATFTGVVRLITNLWVNSSNPCGTNSTNATLAYKMTAPSLPDLIIQQYPSINPQSVVAGGSVTVQFKVINQGNATAGSTTTSFHISTRSYFDNTAVWVADYSTPSLSANTNTGTVSKTFTIPSNTAPGNYYILVSADGTVAINESNKNNQTTYVAITVTAAQQYGNLSVTLSPQDAINKGAQWRVDAGSWRNSGSTQSGLLVGTHSLEFKSATGYMAPQSKNITVTANTTTYESQAYISNATSQISSSNSALDFTNICTSTTKNFTLTNTGNANLIIQPLSNVPSKYTTDLTSTRTVSPGGSTTVYVNFSPGGTGTYTGSLTINSNASNGALTINLSGSCTNTLKPDLTLANISVAPNPVVQGNVITVVCNFKNIGQGNAQNVTVSYWLSNDCSGNTANDYPLGSSQAVTISANGSTNVSMPFKVPVDDTWTGTKYIKCWIDASNNITETNEGNNLLCTQIIVSQLPGQIFTLNGDKSHLMWPFYKNGDASSNNPKTNWVKQQKGVLTDQWYFFNDPIIDNKPHHRDLEWYAQDWNYAGDDCGKDFYTPLTGTIIYISSACIPTNHCLDPSPCNKQDYGNTIVIQAEANSSYVFRVGHLDAFASTNFKAGYRVVSGSKLGKIGTTGASTGSHAHCQLNQVPTDEINNIKTYGYILNKQQDYARDFNFDAVDDGRGGVSGVNTMVNQNVITLYPNPNNGDFTISFESSQEEQMNFTIFNLMGQQVYYEKFNALLGLNTKTYHINGLKSGMYFVVLTSKTASVKAKMLIR